MAGEEETGHRAGAASKAARRDRTAQLLADAAPTIEGQLKRHFRDHGWMVRPLRRVQQLESQVIAVVGDARNGIGGESSVARVATVVGATATEVAEAILVGSCYSPISLNASVPGRDGTPLGESLADHGDPERDAAEARLMLAPALQRLNERDRRILYLPFFECRTQDEIAAELGVTQMQVSRLLRQVCAGVRTMIEGPDKGAA